MEASAARPLVDSNFHSRERFSHRGDRRAGRMVRAGGLRRVLPSLRGLGAVHGKLGPADSRDVALGQNRPEGRCDRPFSIDSPGPTQAALRG